MVEARNVQNRCRDPITWDFSQDIGFSFKLGILGNAFKNHQDIEILKVYHRKEYLFIFKCITYIIYYTYYVRVNEALQNTV